MSQAVLELGLAVVGKFLLVAVGSKTGGVPEAIRVPGSFRTSEEARRCKGPSQRLALYTAQRVVAFQNKLVLPTSTGITSPSAAIPSSTPFSVKIGGSSACQLYVCHELMVLMCGCIISWFIFTQGSCRLAWPAFDRHGFVLS
jgi:hypothetical protein